MHSALSFFCCAIFYVMLNYGVNRCSNVNKLLLYYINKYVIIAETDNVMADTISLKTENLSFIYLDKYLYQIKLIYARKTNL